ncbi:hypothetical protein H261_04917 [Paramagnetospirillum caucaseum]|uniref:DUF6867 domain-containing protein n=1 Tax=Paramagnetospirillum caucaseum TaxID=1244869 RepID=M2Z9J5_9PROT|nr:hypothetical protein [Paramagnetospirillum caucaseum]EME71075.1 hypothetical protein H261_04917 [Paramagnetospirillum caucaseum]
MITSLPVFAGLTLILFGGCAFMTGQALAATWRPLWQVIPYALMLGAADRFLGFALFGGELLSLAGWLLDSAVLAAIGLLAWRRTLVRRMAEQYPWLYVRTGPFSLRKL